MKEKNDKLEKDMTRFDKFRYEKRDEITDIRKVKVELHHEVLDNEEQMNQQKLNFGK